jgi:hypothetical protein
LLGAVVIAIACGCSSKREDRSFAKGLTSAREERAAARNPAYARRLRLSARLAASVKTDSMRKLYLAALDAPRGQVDTVWNAIACAWAQPMSEIGTTATRRAITHLQDSLLAVPGVEERWRAMNLRLSGIGSLEGCKLHFEHQLPDSIEDLPWPNSVP